MYIHQHAYVYEFLLKRKSPDRGYQRSTYTLLTDIEGPKNKRNRELLEQGLRLAYGMMPRGVRYQYDNNRENRYSRKQRLAKS